MPVVKPKIVSSRVKYNRPEQIKPVIGIKEFYEKHNKILIQRSCGGLGDILMHRMMFEDFKKIMPKAEIHFACPVQYHEAVVDHPYVDKVLDSNKSNYHDYIVHYNTTTACGRWEMAMSPMSGKHRSDIWANHCGVQLTSHNMHFRFSEEEKKQGIDIIEENRDRPGKSVILAPISAMHNKNLSDELTIEVAKGIRDRGYYVFGLHDVPIYSLLKNDVPTIHGLKIRKLLSVINQIDYVVSVDTSHFHAAGGMGKPVVGMFTFVNGQTYSMHYPKVEVVQGPCPLMYSGCYDWGKCPKLKESPKIPCCSGMTANSILSAFDRLVSNHKENSSNEAS
jgi:ADP-heptose:LPS heptosyltransferase